MTWPRPESVPPALPHRRGNQPVLRRCSFCPVSRPSTLHSPPFRNWTLTANDRCSLKWPLRSLPPELLGSEGALMESFPINKLEPKPIFQRDGGRPQLLSSPWLTAILKPSVSSMTCPLRKPTSQAKSSSFSSPFSVLLGRIHKLNLNKCYVTLNKGRLVRRTTLGPGGGECQVLVLKRGLCHQAEEGTGEKPQILDNSKAVVLKVGPRDHHQKLLRHTNPGSYPRPAGHGELCFNKSSKWLWASLKLGNLDAKGGQFVFLHCTGLYEIPLLVLLPSLHVTTYVRSDYLAGSAGTQQAA